MKLESIQASELVALLSMTRPAGQLYMPIVIRALEERYGFQTLPSSDALADDVFHFAHGHIQGTAFDLSIYRDGVIIKSASDTTFLEAALEDILQWAETEFGLIENQAVSVRRFYESNIVISGKFELQKAMSFDSSIGELLAAPLKKYGVVDHQYQWTQVSFALDPSSTTGRRASDFVLARRAGLPANSGIYFSSAPLKTSDHLEMLSQLERRLGKK